MIVTSVPSVRLKMWLRPEALCFYPSSTTADLGAMQTVRPQYVSIHVDRKIVSLDTVDECQVWLMTQGFWGYPGQNQLKTIN